MNSTLRKLFTLAFVSVWMVSVSYADSSQVPPNATPVKDDALSITLNDVVRRVSSDNFEVYANALKVYQAKETVQFARMNLLPKLNVWRVTGVAMDAAIGNYSSALGIITDIAPFLVPANWFRVQSDKLLYMAEREGYRAMWANELLTAKALYIHLLLDQSLLEHIGQSEQELKDLLVLVSSREMLGGVPEGVSRDIEIRLLGLQEDKRSLETLVQEEESSLSYLMGYSAAVAVRPISVVMPDFDNLQPLNYSDFEFRTVDSSPELRQFDYFITASDWVKKEAVYSLFGVSDTSRGVAGGVFDSIPIQDGLGFGTPSSIRISNAQKDILKTQRKGVEEVLKRHLKLLVSNYNLDLENYRNLKRRVELTSATNDQLMDRLRLGQDIDILDLIEASKNHIQADTAFFAVKFRFISNEDKLARLIFYGDYSKQPIDIESLKKRK